MKYTTEQLDTITAKLRDMPACEKPKQEYSKQAAVAVLAREIASLQKRGYTLMQIAEALRGEGLDIATPTLKNYLQRTKPASKNAEKSARKKTADTPRPPSKSVARPGASPSAFAPRSDTDDI
jgi:methionine synthase II (cobalamin-independent)